MVNRLPQIILQYFDLGLYNKVMFGDRTEESKKQICLKIIWTGIYYFAISLGVLSSKIMDEIDNKKSIEINKIHLLTSLIIAAVIFPTVYKHASFDSRRANPMQIFISFQFGFFFKSVLGTIQSGFSSTTPTQASY